MLSVEEEKIHHIGEITVIWKFNGIFGITNVGIATILKPPSCSQGKILQIVCFELEMMVILKFNIGWTKSTIIKVMFWTWNDGHFEIQYWLNQINNNKCNAFNGIIGITSMGIATILKPLSCSRQNIVHYILYYIIRNGSHFEIQYWLNQINNNKTNTFNGYLGITNVGIATIFKPLSSSQGKILYIIYWKMAAILKFKMVA